MLGVPLGSDVNTSAFIEDKLIGRAKAVMEKLSVFEDSQSALFLLRLSFASVRAVHFMRTTPLASWSRQADDFDNLVRVTAEQILGCAFSSRRPTSRRVFPLQLVASDCGGFQFTPTRRLRPVGMRHGGFATRSGFVPASFPKCIGLSLWPLLPSTTRRPPDFPHRLPA